MLGPADSQSDAEHIKIFIGGQLHLLTGGTLEKDMIGKITAYDETGKIVVTEQKGQIGKFNEDIGRWEVINLEQSRMVGGIPRGKEAINGEYIMVQQRNGQAMNPKQTFTPQPDYKSGLTIQQSRGELEAAKRFVAHTPEVKRAMKAAK